MRISIFTFLIVIVSAIFPSCQKEYSLEGGIKKFAAGDWEFKEGGTQFAGPIDSAYIETLSGNKKKMHILGTSLNGQQDFTLNLATPDSFTTGVYKASLLQADLQYKAPAKTLYLADQLVGEFTVFITSIANNHITGTFSGAAVDSSGVIKTITEGKFSANINLGNNLGNGGTDATGNLGVSAGSCTPVVISGSYTKGVAMDTTNNILIQVNVVQVGNYTISTNLANGIKFSSAGSFAATGLQNILLVAVGIPVNSGNQVFTVTFGSSSCSFSLYFATDNASLDYFPTTTNSNWTYYLQGGTSGDSIYTTVMLYTPSFNGVEYKSLNTSTIPPKAVSDTEFYRKPGGDYYQYVDFSNVIPFDFPVIGEYVFLKDNVPSGTVWNSDDFSGSIAGIPVTLNIKMTLLAKTVPVTIGAKNFADVIKVKYEYFLSVNPLTPAGTEERWFARGVGLIHDDLVSSATYNISRYTIF